MPVQSKYRNRPPLGERLEIAVTAEQKRQAFELADRRGMSVGQLLREAIAEMRTSAVASVNTNAAVS